MKKLIYILCLLLPLGVLGQAFTQRTNGTFTPTDPRLNTTLNLYIPRVCDTIGALQGGKDTVGALIWDKCGHKLWVRDTLLGGHYWKQLSGVYIFDTVALVPLLLTPSGIGIAAVGDSYTIGSAASPILDSAYIYRLGTYYRIPVINYAVSGTGSITSTYQHFLNINYPNQYLTSAMFGLNNLRFGGGGRKTINKIINGYKDVFCNHFSKTFYPASHSSITRSGSWTINWQSSSGGGKGGNSGAFTTGLNDYIQFPFIDSTVWFSVITGDGSGSIYTSPTIEVYIDGLLNETINLNLQTDGVADGSFDGKLIPLVRYYTGLSFGAHTIRVVNKTAGQYLLFDGFGTLVDRNNANTYVMFHVPKLNPTGYATVPNNANAIMTDTVNVKIDSLYATFPSWYPVRVAKVNNYFDPHAGMSADSIHPNNLGHRQITNSAIASVGTANIPQPGRIFYAQGALWLQNDTGLVKIAVGDVVYNQGQLIFNDSMRIGAFNDKPVAIVSNGATIASFHKGTNYVELLGNTRSFGNLQANAGAIILDNSAGGPNPSVQWRIGAVGTLPSILGNSPYTAVADSRFWLQYMIQNKLRFALLSDDGNTQTTWLEVARTGLHADSVTFPMGKIYFGEMTQETVAPDSLLTYKSSDLQMKRVANPVRLQGSATLDFPSTSAQTSSDLTISVTGAALGDVVALGVPNGAVSANSSFSAWVSSSNTVSVRFNNYSASPIDPGSGTFKVRLIKD